MAVSCQVTCSPTAPKARDERDRGINLDLGSTRWRGIDKKSKKHMEKYGKLMLSTGNDLYYIYVCV
jgi:hypothetical protein